MCVEVCVGRWESGEELMGYPIDPRRSRPTGTPHLSTKGGKGDVREAHTVRFRLGDGDDVCGYLVEEGFLFYGKRGRFRKFD